MENGPFIDGLPINFMVIFHGELLVITRGYVDIKIVPGPPAFIHHPKVPNCSQQGMKPATGFNNQLQPSHQVCDLAVGSDIVHQLKVVRTRHLSGGQFYSMEDQSFAKMFSFASLSGSKV